jgi:hypothetical protein
VAPGVLSEPPCSRGRRAPYSRRGRAGSRTPGAGRHRIRCHTDRRCRTGDRHRYTSASCRRSVRRRRWSRGPRNNHCWACPHQAPPSPMPPPPKAQRRALPLPRTSHWPSGRHVQPQPPSSTSNNWTTSIRVGHPEAGIEQGRAHRPVGVPSTMHSPLGYVRPTPPSDDSPCGVTDRNCSNNNTS